MHIPSRVQVLSWNENQVADLLREVCYFILIRLNILLLIWSALKFDLIWRSRSLKSGGILLIYISS